MFFFMDCIVFVFVCVCFENCVVFVVYFCVGDLDLEILVVVCCVVIEVGMDVLEFGVLFFDLLVDGLMN